MNRRKFLIFSIPTTIILLSAMIFLAFRYFPQTFYRIPLVGNFAYKVYLTRIDTIEFFAPLDREGTLFTLTNNGSFQTLRRVNLVLKRAKIVENPNIHVTRLDGTEYQIKRIVIAPMAYLDDSGKYQEVSVAFMIELAGGKVIPPLGKLNNNFFNGSLEDLVKILNKHSGKQLGMTVIYSREGYIDCNKYSEICAFQSDWASSFSEEMKAFEVSNHIPSPNLVLLSDTYYE